MVQASEITKKTLQMECEEARFALKPWQIETTIVRQLDKNVCTCDIITSEEKAEEIAAEIGRTLLHSQQLREKLAANLHRERQNARKPSLQEIYAPKTTNKPASAPAIKTNHQSNNKENARPSRRSASQFRKVEEKSPRPQQPRRFRSATGVRKPVLEPSKDNLLAQMTGYRPKKPQTNFVLANKMRVTSAKSMDRINSIKPTGDFRNEWNYNGPKKQPEQTYTRKVSKSVDKSTSTNITNDEISTMTELDRLIKKFDDEAKLNSSLTRKSCPIHADNATGSIEERVVTSVDAVEGLDRFGVPAALLKSLKIYHAYIKSELFDENKIVKKKSEDAANNYLKDFERVVKKKQSTQLKEAKSLLGDLSNLCSTCFDPNITNEQYKSTKSKFIDLDPLYNKTDIKNVAGDVRFNRSIDNELPKDLNMDMKNWISNGIWNFTCIPTFQGIFGTHCIRYSERNQLFLFYEFIQNIQKKVYETELINLLLNNVLPKFTQSSDPNSKEYILLYKLIATITQIINLNVPMLAVTDSA